jgi:hypothetical protein
MTCSLFNWPSDCGVTMPLLNVIYLFKKKNVIYSSKDAADCCTLMLADTAHRIPRAKPAEADSFLRVRSTTVEGDSRNGRSRTLLCQIIVPLLRARGSASTRKLTAFEHETNRNKQERLFMAFALSQARQLGARSRALIVHRGPLAVCLLRAPSFWSAQGSAAFLSCRFETSGSNRLVFTVALVFFFQTEVDALRHA